MARVAQPKAWYGPQAPAGTLSVTSSWLWLGPHWLQLSQLEAAQLEVAALSGALSLTANWLSLWPSLPPTFSTAMGICIYYFITPTYFWLDHMIFFCLFTQVCLWLTARSRVSMQHWKGSSRMPLSIAVMGLLMASMLSKQVSLVIPYFSDMTRSDLQFFKLSVNNCYTPPALFSRSWSPSYLLKASHSSSQLSLPFNLLCNSKTHEQNMVSSSFTCWSISNVSDGVFPSQTKKYFRFICCLVFIAHSL